MTAAASSPSNGPLPEGLGFVELQRAALRVAEAKGLIGLTPASAGQMDLSVPTSGGPGGVHPYGAARAPAPSPGRQPRRYAIAAAGAPFPALIVAPAGARLPAVLDDGRILNGPNGEVAVILPLRHLALVLTVAMQELGLVTELRRARPGC